MSNKDSLLDIAYCAVFVALLIVLAFVYIPFGAAGVPMVFQDVAVIFAGIVLGGRRGFLTVMLFFAIGLVLPVLAGGRTVIAAVAGPTVGYLVGYVASATAAGFIAYRARPGRRGEQIGWFTLAGVIGLALNYLCGIGGLMVAAKLDLGAAAAVQVPFIIPDSAKMALLVVVALGVHAAFPDLLRKAHPRTTGTEAGRRGTPA